MQLVTQIAARAAAVLPLGRIAIVADAFLELGRAFGDRIGECEVNPFVVADDGRIVALDVLVKLRREPAGDAAARGAAHRQAVPLARAARRSPSWACPSASIPGTSSSTT